MPTYDENGLPLEDSPGLGLASAPGTQLMEPSAELVSEPPGSEQLSTPSFNMSSLGFAAPPESRTQSDKDYLQNLPTMQKIGLMLQSYSAGVEGRGSPVDELLKRKRLQDKERRDEIMNTITVIDKGMGVLRKLPRGLQRDAVAKELGKAVGPQYAHVFEAAGTENESELLSLMAVFTDPDVQQTLIKACSSANDFGTCWRKQANDEGFMKRAYATSDAKQYPAVTQKLRAMMENIGKAQGMDEFKAADGKYEIPFTKLSELNTKLSLFTPTEMDFIKRHDAEFEPFGIKSQKAMEAGAAERAKQAERPAKDWSEPYMLNGAMVQKNAATGEIRTAVSRAPQSKASELTAAQKMKLEREQAGYDNAQKQMKQYGIGPDGASSRPEIQKRLMPNVKVGNLSDRNPEYDPQFAGRVKAWMKAIENGDPSEREGGKGATPKAAGDKFNLVSWEKTKRIHNLTDAQLEQRLGKKKPAK